MLCLGAALLAGVLGPVKLPDAVLGSSIIRMAVPQLYIHNNISASLLPCCIAGAVLASTEVVMNLFNLCKNMLMINFWHKIHHLYLGGLFHSNPMWNVQAYNTI